MSKTSEERIGILKKVTPKVGKPFLIGSINVPTGVTKLGITIFKRDRENDNSYDVLIKRATTKPKKQEELPL